MYLWLVCLGWGGEFIIINETHTQIHHQSAIQKLKMPVESLPNTSRKLNRQWLIYFNLQIKKFNQTKPNHTKLSLTK